MSGKNCFTVKVEKIVLLLKILVEKVGFLYKNWFKVEKVVLLSNFVK